MKQVVCSLAVSALIAGTASCTHTTSRPHDASRKVVSVVDDARAGLGVGRIHYSGHWERVGGRGDGRDEGTSTRSFHVGDNFALAFDGYRLRVYGVVGPKGGHAILGIDEVVNLARLDFFAPRKRTHALLYTSPVLADGIHVAAVIVDAGRDRRSRGGYVNIDSVAIEAHRPPPVAASDEAR